MQSTGHVVFQCKIGSLLNKHVILWIKDSLYNTKIRIVNITLQSFLVLCHNIRKYTPDDRIAHVEAEVRVEKSDKALLMDVDVLVGCQCVLGVSEHDRLHRCCRGITCMNCVGFE